MVNIDLERLKEKAIEEAVNGRYENAININLEILKLEPADIDSLMQLAHAYWQTGNLADAKKHYRKALEIDPNNNLAKKRLSLLSSLGENNGSPTKRKASKIITITDLIEEPGKTKIVRLSNIGKPEHLGMLKIGEELFLKIRKRKLEVRDIENNFIGYLPDDISKRLIEFITEKANFEAYVFSIDRNEVKVFVREIWKPVKFKNISSFVSEDINLTVEDEEEEETHVLSADEGDLDLDSDKILLTPEEIESNSDKSNDDEDDEEEETDPDDSTYRELEE